MKEIKEIREALRWIKDEIDMKILIHAKDSDPVKFLKIFEDFAEDALRLMTDRVSMEGLAEIIREEIIDCKQKGLLQVTSVTLNVTTRNRIAKSILYFLGSKIRK